MADPTPPGGTARRDLPPGTPATLGGGRYVLDGILGSGGMGLVYQAADGVLGRQVAVKVLADNLALDPEARERFSREARAAARLTHPNVVQVFDVGEEDGRPYLVMELVPGASLADALRDHGPLAARDVEDVAVQALHGLARAHAAGVLHRDLKPGNLLRDEAGVVKVTDFGVAQAAELPGMTRTGLVLGTLPYLAPERLAGAPATVASDLYGLGATLLELLTGTSPDGGGTGNAGAPWQHLDTVPPRLAGLIRSCLARDPGERPGSVDDALAILEGDLPVPAAPRAPAAATEVLPVEGHAPTVAVGSVAAGSARMDAGDAAPAADGTAGQVEHARPLRARGWVRRAVVAGVAIMLVAALTSLAQRDPDAPAGDDPPPVDAEGDEGVPAGETPADTARNLAEWLRERGR